MILVARGSRPWVSLVSRMAQRVAAARRARALHPRGRTYHATVMTCGGGGYGVDLLDHGAVYPALARLSRGAGLPGGWPDVLGVAVRVWDAGGPGADLDLLASTVAGTAPVARHVPWPRRRARSPYTTIAGYGTRLGRRYFAVLPDPDAPPLADPGVPARFRLAVASASRIGGSSGDWPSLGRRRTGSTRRSPSIRSCVRSRACARRGGFGDCGRRHTRAAGAAAA
jgi:hypothetical protein